MPVATYHDGHVAIVEFENPPANFINVDLASEIADALDACDTDANVRAVVLCSAGKNFCAGADLAQKGDRRISVADLYVQTERLFAAKKPIVAAVQGAAVGAGLGVAVVADFRVVARNVRLTANFVKLGFHPGFGLTLSLPRIIGEQRASFLFLTGRRIQAEEALAWGLADAIAEDDQVRHDAIALAREIAENAPLAVQATRATLRGELAKAVRAQTDVELKEQTWLRETEDFAEGVRAVNERRAGNFVGR